MHRIADIHPFEDFTRENEKIWLPFTERLTKPSDKCILVDLLVTHPGYFIGNATVAKYLQSLLGCNVVGLVPSLETPGLIAMVKSFGIEKVIVEPDFSKQSGELLPAVKQVIEFIKGGDLKTRLLNIRFNDNLVGDLIYDSYLRETGKSEVAGIDDGLVTFIYTACAYVAHYGRVMSDLDVVATVQGHVVYNRFGILARLALSKGATVYGKKYAEAPFTVRCYRTLEDVMTFEYTFSAEEFDALWRVNRDLAIDGGRRYLAERFAAQTPDGDVMLAFGPEKKLYGRQELAQELGLPQGRFTAFIMPHVHCDSPHRNRGMLYQDFHDWLIDTIDQAVTNDRVNWIIKPHPSEHCYENAVTTRQLAAGLVADVPHVAIAPDDLNTAALPELADAIVTAVGTVAAELPAVGIPAVIAGEGPISGLGIANEPKTLDEYRRILATIEDLPKPTQEQMERALAYIYFSFKLCRVDSSLIPPTDLASSEAYDRNFFEYWKAAAELARNFGGVENDPLYANIRRQVETGADHVLNFDWFGVDVKTAASGCAY